MRNQTATEKEVEADDGFGDFGDDTDVQDKNAEVTATPAGEAGISAERDKKEDDFGNFGDFEAT